MTITVGEDADGAEAVGAGLREANAGLHPILARYYAGGRREMPVHIVAREGEAVVGGVTAVAFPDFGWLAIDRVWVAASHRGRGLGSELVRRAEDEGRRLGCRHARLETLEIQAPEFYRRLGYVEYGRLEGSVGEVAEIFMRKEL